jgi:hypothetical protein
MNVKIGAEAAQFPEKEYISGIDVAVHDQFDHPSMRQNENYTFSVNGFI